jgi:hypothetical protein
MSAANLPTSSSPTPRAIDPATEWATDSPPWTAARFFDLLRHGRNVLFFELREHADAAPFLRIYVYRAPSVEFAPEIARAFQRAHAELEHGVQLATGEN